ncbi:MAG: 1-deoxy-D-xylulose-5-phosphate synthase [Steroidobacteraceae bacterium]|nr:1-deoxy-D-xylulose-5-phosphate synthase [Nevskiaceae bacterium]MCP5339544.1 1-deoxy-D-xylulose-5-phosphate synthase [Nevskiaceae bacterium]MCP5359164.1 1-deoxy-D-xylulose-5-phosphate synthase [Nevskiaceae bacterium]MCP5466398.1 1-deoxy-D-xylulose-5-phosphate synthase [Nevskiaceae bacterium]MCP5471901.1 1-deoxy-D-xylulose-5-phosphate synthase [Nevskiaceae bacterium]
MTGPASLHPLLSGIESPTDLRRLEPSQLAAVCAELRDYLIRTVATRGGHFAAGLGTVELTVALHYVYDTPHDRLVWDVGHQAYPHKVLTGRRDRLATIKQKDGLAPFPARSESIYDTFGVGHSSTSISAALGMAVAAQQEAIDRRVVAVIGDGAMTAGMAFEALNNAGSLKADLLVVLNDNDMSISENVGAMSHYFARILSGRMYAALRERGKKVLRQMPTVWELARRSEEHVKGMVLPGTLFEELGFNYIGPIDGHDVDTLVATLRNQRKLRGPQFLHVVTRKGKGYAPAEADPIKWHGPGPFDPASGTIFKDKATGPSFTQVFGQWLCDMAEREPRLIGITPAMREGSGLVEFSKRFPKRYFDVAIAEQHAVTFAAGLACEGLKPVVAIYSTFLQRAYDQLIHDVALQNLPIVFALDRAGLVGSDGSTHQGAFDLSYLRCIPNMVIMAPADENECRQMLYTATTIDGPTAVRYPRGTGPGVAIESQLSALPVGRGEIRREGRAGLAILCFGTLLQAALAIGERLDATVVNMRFVKPLDEELVLHLSARHRGLVTVEENVLAGGAGAAVTELLAAADVQLPQLSVGIPDRFIEHGSREDCLAAAGLDAAGLARTIEGWWAAHHSDRARLVGG